MKRNFYLSKTLCILFLLFFTQAYALDPTEKAVQQAYYDWCAAIGTAKGNADAIVKFYAPNAILHPTLSNQLLVNRDKGLNDYFHQLTSRDDIQCSPKQLVNEIFNYALLSLHQHAHPIT